MGGIEQLEQLTDSIADELTFWQKIVENPLTIESYAHLTSDPHLALKQLQPYFEDKRASSYLEEIQTQLLPNLAGYHLAHTDIRADNILIDGEGAAVIIDWPWACYGAAFFDSASLLADVVAQGGTFTWDTVLTASETLARVPRRLVELHLIAMCGYYLVAAQIPHQSDTSSTLPAFRLQRALTMSAWLLTNC